jgi:hypothetical protein
MLNGSFFLNYVVHKFVEYTSLETGEESSQY